MDHHKGKRRCFLINHSHFPLFLPTVGETVLIVGGGTIATRRISTLLQFQFTLKVVTLEATEEIKKYHEEGLLSLQLREVKEIDFQQVKIALFCTDSPETNIFWRNYGKKQGILCNVCHDQTLCDFFFPAIVTKDTTVVAMVGDGKSHKKVAHLKKILEKEKESL